VFFAGGGTSPAAREVGIWRSYGAWEILCGLGYNYDAPTELRPLWRSCGVAATMTLLRSCSHH